MRFQRKDKNKQIDAIVSDFLFKKMKRSLKEYIVLEGMPFWLNFNLKEKTSTEQ